MPGRPARYLVAMLLATALGPPLMIVAVVVLILLGLSPAATCRA